MSDCGCQYCTERRTLNFAHRSLKRRNPDSPSIDRRLRDAEREYIDFPGWETWGKYNWVRRQAGLPEIPVPTEKGTINALPGFWITATLGKYTKLRRNPTCSWISNGHRISREYCDKPSSEMGLCEEHYDEIQRKESMRSFLEMKRRFARKGSMPTFRRNPYSQEDRDKVIAECRDTDSSYRAIALKTGVSRETVSRWCKDAGYPRRRGRKGASQGKRQKILDLHQNTDLNFSQIARHDDVQLPRTTVRDIIKSQDERSKILRRRNPDDLERLEKMVEAREVYKETGLFVEAARAVGVSANTVKKWLGGLIQKPTVHQHPQKGRIGEKDFQKWKQIVKGLKKKNYSKLGLAKTLVEELEKQGFSYSIAAARSWVNLVNKPPGLALKILDAIDKIPKIKKDERLSLYEQGLPDEEIAQQLGLTLQHVVNWRRRLRILPNKIKEEDPRLVLYEQGFTDTEIAEELKINRSAVSQWRFKNKLKPNKTKSYIEKRERVLELYKNTDLGTKKIAVEVGVGFRTARKWIKDSDLNYIPKSKKIKIDFSAIVNFVKQRGCVQSSDLRERFKLSKNVVRWVLRELVEQGDLEKIGKRGRFVKYCLAKGPLPDG